MSPAQASFTVILIGLLALFWLRLVEFAARVRNVGERTRNHWLARRWRVTGWLLVIELVLGQDLLGRFLSVVSGVVV